MPVETHLIRVSDNATSEQVESLLRALVNIGAKVEVVVKKSIVATFDSDYAGKIRKKAGVKLVGGVDLRERTVRKVVKRNP